MAFRQGRSKRNDEAYVVWYVESLIAARTQQKAIFTSLKRKGLRPWTGTKAFRNFVVPP